MDEKGFLTEENFEEGVRRTFFYFFKNFFLKVVYIFFILEYFQVRRTGINTDLYVRFLAKDPLLRYMGLDTFKSIVKEESQSL